MLHLSPSFRTPPLTEECWESDHLTHTKVAGHEKEPEREGNA